MKRVLRVDVLDDGNEYTIWAVNPPGTSHKVVVDSAIAAIHALVRAVQATGYISDKGLVAALSRHDGEKEKRPGR